MYWVPPRLSHLSNYPDNLRLGGLVVPLISQGQKATPREVPCAGREKPRPLVSKILEPPLHRSAASSQVQMPYDPAVPPVDIHPRERTSG